MRWAQLACALLIAHCAAKQPAPAERSPPEKPAVAAPVNDELVPMDAPVPLSSARAADSGAPGVCQGSASPELVEELRSRMSDTKDCYERALLEDGRLEGRLVIGLRVEADGRVSNASVSQDGVGNQRFTTCVVHRLTRPTAALPEHGCVDVLVPIRFRPVDAGAQAGP